MTAFNGTPQTYDANGNLANDGTNSYASDARNHLTAIAGPNTASFAYDADGRRAQKTIAGTATQFLYDGLNPVRRLPNRQTAALFGRTAPPGEAPVAGNVGGADGKAADTYFP
jgi:YD repeat-containing protein